MLCERLICTPFRQHQDEPNSPSAVLGWRGKMLSRMRLEGVIMCEQCDEIDEKIDRYGTLASRVADQTLIDGANELVDLLGALKDALHQRAPTPQATTFSLVQ